MSIEARLSLGRGDFQMDLDLDIPATGITSIHGPSGSGKTTLLRAIAGLARHPGSFISVNEITWQDDQTFVPVHQRSLGYVFQESSLFPHLDVRRNIEYGVRRGKKGPHMLEKAMELLGIESLRDRYPSSLSGGERRRVAIARALAPKPSLLLLDEPCSGLDATHRSELLGYLESLHSELSVPVLHVSHSAAEVLRLADRLILLQSGRITASGTLTDLQTRLDLGLSREEGAATMVEARVREIDQRYGLAVLEHSGGILTVINDAFEPGQRLRVSIAARDVSISLTEPEDSSILNTLRASIDAMTDLDSALVLLKLDAGGSPLLARITRKSAQRLSLAVGMNVFAQVKSVALLQQS
ncbi:MAG: molybdenum ABC transporter ATP-binding protein [Xanthomonadales bacterium]|nr:molybdenum ABC transporter ATP-binding protein [Xanthomonadales bacterium]